MDNITLLLDPYYDSNLSHRESNFDNISQTIKKELAQTMSEDFVGEKKERADILREHTKNRIPGRRGYQATQEAIQGYTFSGEELQTIERLAYGAAGVTTIISIVLLLHNGINHNNRGLGLIEQQTLAKISSMILGPAQAKVLVRNYGDKALEEFKQMLKFQPKQKLINLIKKLQNNLSQNNDPVSIKIQKFLEKSIFTLEYKKEKEIENTTNNL